MPIAPWLLAALLISASPVLADGREVTLSLPPESIAQWYKPQNERQVWLHVMFNLRRSMQAVGLYTALGDKEALVQWTDRLVADYRRIPEMVPEWEDEVDFRWADRLAEAARKTDRDGISEALQELGTTCQSCHNEYMAVTAAIYRYPDFEEVRVENPETLEEVGYSDLMEGLSTALNRVIIGVKDGRWSAAKTATGQLETRLALLGESCSRCHDDAVPRERILGDHMDAGIAGLMRGIETEDRRAAGEQLGNLGVEVCARCHGVHRTLSDLRHQILSAGAPPVPEE